MRILVLSDIHANLAAFEAVLAHAGSFDRVWCLGDIVGYGPDPNECVERVRELRRYQCLAGNHDWAALGKLDLSDFNTDARLAALWTRQQLTPDNRAFLDARLEYIGPLEDRYTLVHGSPRYPIWEYILDEAIAAENFPYFSTQVCLVGHTHVPVIYAETPAGVRALRPPLDKPHPLGDQRLIINPGSVGQPRDGDPRASYLLLDVDASTVTYRRVDYPIEVTQEKMAVVGLPPRIIARLEYGW
ncbi:MAG: metallophosphoesterase family protein [Anaerolineae bacterium]|nr:metallophosphoesterase family protein [Anaerolineae bacterium]